MDFGDLVPSGNARSLGVDVIRDQGVTQVYYSTPLHGVTVGGNRQFYPLGGSHHFSITLEEKPSDIVLLTDYLVPSWEESPFQGGLLWITGFGIWGENSEKTGLMMLKRMLSGCGESATLAENPAQLFGAEEIYETHSFLLLPILFGWDALWIPATADYVVSISHHGTASVTSRNRAVHDELRSRMKDWLPRKNERAQQPA